MIFTIQASYSLAVPVINVFGFMYISIKHLVDRYNLFFVTRPSRHEPGEIARNLIFNQILTLGWAIDGQFD